MPDKIRPCTAAELLAYQFMQGYDIPTPLSETQEQQSFIDEREGKVKKTKVAKPEDAREVEPNEMFNVDPHAGKVKIPSIYRYNCPTRNTSWTTLQECSRRHC